MTIWFGSIPRCSLLVSYPAYLRIFFIPFLEPEIKEELVRVFLLPKSCLALLGKRLGIHHVAFLPFNDKQNRQFLLGLYILVNVIKPVISL
jgi:hypothetical protein